MADGLSGTVDLAVPLARLAQGVAGQSYPAGALYVVATPIGNLGDLSVRAVHVLGLVDAVACEDTRVSGQMLSRLGLSRPLLSLHQHNEQHMAAEIVGRLQAGQRIAYVSDAGTPGISDPGARLAHGVRAAGLKVVPLPGPSTVVSLLSVAGDVQAQGHDFLGFLPSKAVARRRVLQPLLQPAATEGPARSLVLFEAPHRMAELLADLAELAPQRQLTLGRELTKQFEQIVSMPAAEAPSWLAAHADHGRGEFAVVIHAEAAPARVDEALPPEAERWLRVLLTELPVKQASSLAAQALGLPRKQLYRHALALQGSGPSDDGDPEPAMPD
ncbi:MAG: hypothetical protein RL722_2663 [Pseudomonadota bacterium]